MGGRCDAVPSQWPAVFASGLWFDVVTTIVLPAPFWFYEARCPTAGATRAHHAIRLAAFFATVFAPLFVAGSEVLFWQEFSTPLSSRSIT